MQLLAPSISLGTIISSWQRFVATWLRPAQCFLKHSAETLPDDLVLFLVCKQTAHKALLLFAKYLLNTFCPQTHLRVCYAQKLLTLAELVLSHQQSRKSHASGFAPRPADLSSSSQRKVRSPTSPCWHPGGVAGAKCQRPRRSITATRGFYQNVSLRLLSALQSIDIN